MCIDILSCSANWRQRRCTHTHEANEKRKADISVIAITFFSSHRTRHVKKRQQSPLPHLIVVGLRHGEWRRRDKSPGRRTDRILED